MTRYASAFVVLSAVLCVSMHSLKSAEPSSTSPGKTIADFTLKDTRGQNVSLTSFKDKKAVVVVFVGTECPVNNAYMPRLAELAKTYETRGVQFLAINSNVQDGLERVAEHARQNEIPFPVLKDRGSDVADLFAAQRTPEVFVLDGQRAVRYKGRIDDQIGIGFKRAQPTRRDLAIALDEVLAAKPVTQPTTTVAGCVIARAARAKGDARVTYTRDVVRIMQKNCQECHRAGQIGPMALMTYENVSAWSESIREVVQEKRMPPWFADHRFGKYLNDRSLPDKERETLLAWIDQGCPKGDDKDMPPAREFDPSWRIGKPDMIFTMKESYEVPAVGPKGGIEYKYFQVDTGFKEDRWVERAEARAGADSVVHHIIIFISAPGKGFVPRQGNGPLLCGTAPGDMPLLLEPGNAKRIPAGSKLVFQMHYTANGKAATDRSSVGLIFAKEPPKREVRTFPVLNQNIHIPPGAENYERESQYTFTKDNMHILGFMPHMHLRGKDVKAETISRDGKRETVLWIPHYNFNWQSSYRLETPIDMPKGSKIHFVAHFDNSEKNPNNPDPTKEVYWGDQTWDEMMIGWTDIAFDVNPSPKTDK